MEMLKVQKKIIIFSNKKRLNSISTNDYKEIFIDIIFKKFRNVKDLIKLWF